MRRLALALSLGLALGLGACSSDSTGPNGSVTGTYNLQTINGNHLPVTFTNGETITAEQYTLNGDGSYTEVTNYSTSNYIEYGYYTVNGNFVTFTPNNTTGYSGSVSGPVLTISVGSYNSVYSKQ